MSHCTVLQCRLAGIFCWNKHGTSLLSHDTQTWLVWGGREDGWRSSGLGCRGTRGGCTLVPYLRKMSQIGNGSSHMDSHPDTMRILINKPHTDGGRGGCVQICTAIQTNWSWTDIVKKIRRSSTVFWSRCKEQQKPCLSCGTIIYI